MAKTYEVLWLEARISWETARVEKEEAVKSAEEATRDAIQKTMQGLCDNNTAWGIAQKSWECAQSLDREADNKQELATDTYNEYKQHQKCPWCDRPNH